MSKSYVNKDILNMPKSGIRKFFDIASHMDDVVSLGVGEPDFETPWNIREAAISTLEKGRTSYTANQGLMELRSAICGYLSEKFNINYDPEKEVVCTVGASEGIDIAMKAITEIGDEILVVEPCFVSYKPCVTMAGGIPVVISTKMENDFRLQPEELEAKITPKTKALLISYPNNPTGAIMEREDLEKLVPIIIKHDLLVISDEIYAELTYGTKHVSIAEFPGMKERTIVLNGFSKAFAMTGWRLGYAAGPAEIIDNMNKIHQYIIMCAPTTSQYAGVEALTCENRDDFIEEMAEAYDIRRRLMVSEFNRMGLECFEPKGAFYVFPSIKSTGMTSEEFCEKLLMQEKVATVPGHAFGESGEGHIRCSYAYSVENIKWALSKIAMFVSSLK